MALFNYATRELSAKIVYYGPGLSGKTTNIEMVHRILRPDQKGRLISLPTETDRTLFFDFLPVDLGQIKGFKVRFHLYTVPGQVFYNATRRLVLQGVDGVVFVADSQADMEQSNVESLRNLVENLATYGKKLEDLPFVLQYNKRDLRQILPVQKMNAQLNPRNVPVVEGIAKDGVGVSETLVTISRMVFSHLRKTLLMPGETAEHEEIGKLADAKLKESFRVQEAEPLEEISEIEEIEEIREEPKPPKEPEIRKITEIPWEPEIRKPPEIPREPEIRKPPEIQREPEVRKAPEAPKVSEVRKAPEIPRAPEVRKPPEIPREPEIREAPPAPEEPVTAQASVPAPEEPEIVPAAPPVEEPAPARGLLEGLDEIEIEIPSSPPAPPAAQEPRAAISVETEEGALTFLKFEGPHITPEGHAVLPAVFLDAQGNVVRLRIRIAMEAQE
jgi:signal recognition particle receptor subunit beta